MKATFQTLIVLIIGTMIALPAVAQERSLNLVLGGGLAAVPEYPGSDEYKIQPDVIFTFGSFTWGKVSIGSDPATETQGGLKFGGAFRFLGARDAADNPELAGLTDIDEAVELGFGLSYEQRNWRAFGQVRQGFGGHEGVTGTLGADVIFRPTDRLTVSAGPRLNLGDGEYAGTYFGVSQEDAARSNFGAFEADGGLLGAGFQVRGSYEVSGPWSVEGQLSYERLRNSAADSPITQSGSEDQWRLSIGLSRALNLRF